MTTKDYIKFANMMRHFDEMQDIDFRYREWQQVRTKLIEIFTRDNSKFDVNKFKKACVAKVK